MSGSRRRSVSVLLTIAALWFAFMSLEAVSDLQGYERRADSFDADQAGVLHTTATVASISFVKPGKSVGNTSGEVTWADGKGSDHIYLSDSDVVSQAPVGSHLPVAVWRGHVMRFEFAGEWHTTDDYPAALVDDWRGLVCVFPTGAAVCGRIGARRWLGTRVDHRRFLAGELLVLPFLAAIVVAAATSHLASLNYLVPSMLAALLVSALALPAVPWMRAPSTPRVTAPPEPDPDPVS